MQCRVGGWSEERYMSTKVQNRTRDSDWSILGPDDGGQTGDGEDGVAN